MTLEWGCSSAHAPIAHALRAINLAARQWPGSGNVEHASDTEAFRYTNARTGVGHKSRKKCRNGRHRCGVDGLAPDKRIPGLPFSLQGSAIVALRTSADPRNRSCQRRLWGTGGAARLV